MKYFLTILPIHFQPVIDKWKVVLEKRYHEKFEEIKILNIGSNGYYDKSIKSYRFLNKPQNYSSLNKHLSKNKQFKALVKSLLHKQKDLLILPYSTSNLFILNKGVFILGPNSNLATYFDNKINAYGLFKKLKINTPKFRLIINKSKYIVKNPIYITAAFSSGTDQSRLISNQNDYLDYLNKIEKINNPYPFISLDYVKDIRYFVETSCMVISDKKVEVLSILDEVKRGTACIGNIYPSIVSTNQKEKMIKISKKIGLYIAKKGYRGPFGCGFFITKDNVIYVSDLNPRRQGFYMGDVCISRANIPQLELNVYEGNNPIANNYLNKKVCKYWAYSLVYADRYIKLKANYFKKYTVERLQRKGTNFFSFYKKGDFFRRGVPFGYMTITDIFVNEKIFSKKKVGIIRNLTKANFGLSLLWDRILHKLLSFYENKSSSI